MSTSPGRARSPSIGEYVFSADAADAAATTSWPSASSASVLSAATGGPNVVTWNLGSTTAPVPGEIITSGYTTGIYGFRGADQTTFRKYGIDSLAWTARANALGTVKQGGALTTDGAGIIYGLRGDGTQAFWAHDVATDTWTAKANTGTNVGEGGALVFLTVGGTKYVYATMGNGTVFKRYDVAANTWATMTAPPNNIKKGGALTTDGTNIYVLRGDKQKTFFRYNVAANTWTTLAPLAVNVGWGGSLTFVGGSIYALTGDGKKNFYRYNIGANTWTPLAAAPGNVAEGGALTNDGTFIYAFQGKTNAFWRYDIAANTWTPLAPFSAAHQPGRRPRVRARPQPAGPAHDYVCLPLAGRHRRPGHGDPPARFEHSGQQRRRGAADRDADRTGASCSALTGPTSSVADDDDLTAARRRHLRMDLHGRRGRHSRQPDLQRVRDRRRSGRLPVGDVEQRARVAPAHLQRDRARRGPEPDRRPGTAGGQRPDRELAPGPDVHRPAGPDDRQVELSDVRHDPPAGRSDHLHDDRRERGGRRRHQRRGQRPGAGQHRLRELLGWDLLWLLPPGPSRWTIGTLAPGDTATVSFTVATSTTLARLRHALHDLEHRQPRPRPRRRRRRTATP